MKSVDSGKGAEVEFHTCEVHKLVDGDQGPRLCKWCNACKAWICSECWHSPKRLEAAMKRWMGGSDARVG